VVFQIFLQETHVLPKLVSYEEHCRQADRPDKWCNNCNCKSNARSIYPGLALVEFPNSFVNTVFLTIGEKLNKN
jgi:hypothetical protein